MINIDKLISEATKSKSPALATYRLVKAEFLRWTKDNPSKKFDELTANKILKKMCKERQEAVRIYWAAGRDDLAESELKEIEYIQPFLLKEPSDKEVKLYTTQIIETEFEGKVSMKDMKKILSLVQAKFPGASGKIVSLVVKAYATNSK
jgi:uncharacterized protein